MGGQLPSIDDLEMERVQAAIDWHWQDTSSGRLSSTRTSYRQRQDTQRSGTNIDGENYFFEGIVIVPKAQRSDELYETTSQCRSRSPSLFWTLVVAATC
jgi:hypothetical protein